MWFAPDTKAVAGLNGEPSFADFQVEPTSKQIADFLSGPGCNRFDFAMGLECGVDDFEIIREFYKLNTFDV